jgi:hypothetical protein
MHPAGSTYGVMGMLALLRAPSTAPRSGCCRRHRAVLASRRAAGGTAGCSWPQWFAEGEWVIDPELLPRTAGATVYTAGSLALPSPCHAYLRRLVGQSGTAADITSASCVCPALPTMYPSSRACVAPLQGPSCDRALSILRAHCLALTSFHRRRDAETAPVAAQCNLCGPCVGSILLKHLHLHQSDPLHRRG